MSSFKAWHAVMNDLVLARESEPMRSTRRMAIERAIVALRAVWTFDEDRLQPRGIAHRDTLISERLNLRRTE